MHFSYQTFYEIFSRQKIHNRPNLIKKTFFKNKL